MSHCLRILIVVFVILPLYAAQEDSPFILKQGHYRLFDDSLRIDVAVSGGKVTYTIGTDRFSGGTSPREAFEADTPWFLYPESSTRVWIYYGAGPLHLVTVTKSEVVWDNTNATPGLLRVAPKPVVDRRNTNTK